MMMMMMMTKQYNGYALIVNSDLYRKDNRSSKDNSSTFHSSIRERKKTIVGANNEGTNKQDD